MRHRFCWIWCRDVGLWNLLKDRPSKIYATQSRLSRRCTSQMPTPSAPLQKSLETLITTLHFILEYVPQRLLFNGTRTPVVEGVVSSSIFDSYVRHINRFLLCQVSFCVRFLGHRHPIPPTPTGGGCQ